MSGEHELQTRLGTTIRAQRFYREQLLCQLNPTMAAFVGRADMAFIATSDAAGHCDVSFRAGPPGFVHVIDAATIAYPEYRGNGVMASLGNIAENPHIAIMIIDFVHELIGLHINGTARIVDDDEMRRTLCGAAPVTMPGQTAQLWVQVHVEEAYIHCRKHIPRMQPVATDRDWGTDSTTAKGGDYFGAKHPPRTRPPLR